MYFSLEEMVVATAEAVRPVERLTVSEAASRYHIVKNPGQHEGPFSLTKTPYLVEPMDVLTSLDYTAMAFAGPARTGKSAMGINWLTYTAIVDPADMMFVTMAQHIGREWSKMDLSKAIRNSPELRKRIRPSRHDDNVFDKEFLSGMVALITWPTMKNLSGKTIPRQFIMDSDRIKPQIIDGEAHVFDATRKRGGTFRRYAMCGIEGSPGFPNMEPQWAPSADHPHEGPPCEGIISIYNRGDRRRWFWRCPHCNEAFQPRFNLLQWPDSADFIDAAEQCYMACPHCFLKDGAIIEPRMQAELNAGARWIKEGQIWLPDGTIAGKGRRSDIASFWMFGPAAGFTDWPKLVLAYLQALETYEKTGDEGPLMTTVNVDQGEVYTPKALETGRQPDALKSRAEHWGGTRAEPVVPMAPGGGFLLALVDVQAGSRPSFVVHVFLVAPPGDIWHVDMFKIRKSERLDDAGERHLLDPASYVEDWKTSILPQVMERTYPLGDGSGRRMRIRATASDSGGAGSTIIKSAKATEAPTSVTSNAYHFYRWLRAEGKHQNFHLLKGSPSKSDTTPIRLTYPDAPVTDMKFAAARGDVPVWLVNSNVVKDQAFNMIGRTEPGGQIHFPLWFDETGKPEDIGWLYTQLTTEVRTSKGWENPSRRRNEAFDLLSYCVAMLRHRDIQAHVPGFWENPPEWAAPYERNSLVFDPRVSGPTTSAPEKPSLASLASKLA